jgi:hypothetical protein
VNDFCAMTRRSENTFARQVTVPDASTRLVTEISAAWAAWPARARPTPPG